MSSHTTAGQSPGTSVQATPQFLSTYQGTVKLIELACGAAANIFHNWCICYYWYTDALFLLNLATPFYVISFWINVILFLLHLCNLNNVWTRMNWRMMEVVFCAVCTALSFVFMIIDFFWGAFGQLGFRFHLLLAGMATVLLFLSFATETLLLFTGRTGGVIVWNRRATPIATTVTA